MKKHTTRRFHEANRLQLRSQIKGNIPIVVSAHGQLQRNGDTTYPFRQDSNFWYLTGIDIPDVILVMTQNEDYLIVPARSTSRESFDGAINFSMLTQLSGIQIVLDYDSGWNKLQSELSSHGSVATPRAAPAYIEGHGMFTNPARSRLDGLLKSSYADLTIKDIRNELTNLRMVKQPEELAALKQAIDITTSTIELLTEPTRFKQYTYEFEIEAELTREFRFQGSTGHAFAPIVASGAQACTLHNVSNSEVITPNSLVIMDVGAEVGQYAADITRTRVHGTPTARQRTVFDAVADVQEYALNLLKPGVLLSDYEKRVEAYMGKTLLKIGLITSSGDHDAIRRYYPHATSHFLGLDVHDVGDYVRPLEPGMVLTCEPGIYIPEESIGVRIEDDLVITNSGNRVMSIQLPKTLM